MSRVREVYLRKRKKNLSVVKVKLPISKDVFLCLTNCLIQKDFAIVILRNKEQTKLLRLCKIFIVCADVFTYL